MTVRRTGRILGGRRAQRALKSMLCTVGGRLLGARPPIRPTQVRRPDVRCESGRLPPILTTESFEAGSQPPLPSAPPFKSATISFGGRAASGEMPSESFDEAVVALVALGLGGGLSRVGQRRHADEPEADK
jgi:hypothetical protein